MEVKFRYRIGEGWRPIPREPDRSCNLRERAKMELTDRHAHVEKALKDSEPCKRRRMVPNQGIGSSNFPGRSERIDEI